jgi:hypothetical protein
VPPNSGSDLLLKVVQLKVEGELDASINREQKRAAKTTYQKFEEQNRAQFAKALSGAKEEEIGYAAFEKKESKAKNKVVVVTDADMNASLRSDIAGLGDTLLKGLPHQPIVEEDTQRNKSSRRSDLSAGLVAHIERKVRERAKSTDPTRRRIAQ